MASQPTKADIAVEHVIAALVHDGRKAYLMGLGTECFDLLTEAYAERHGLDLQTYRADIWRDCTPIRVEAVEV